MQIKNIYTKLQKSQPFSIYIHWPYCESKCTYCNFNKYVNPKDPPHDRLVKAMNTELAYFLNHSKYQLYQRPLHSIYFGGGTPSLVKPEAIQSILDTIHKYVKFQYQPLFEISMEANPTSIEQSKLKAFKAAGINRLSLGVQSFHDNDLKRLGRDHSGKEAIQAIELSKDIFSSEKVTFDLIFARPGQTTKDWAKELKFALGIAGDHLSLYQLTLEKSTPLHKQFKRGLLPRIPDTDRAADMYEEAVCIMQDHGYTHYEVSNYTKTQHAMSRHNFSYWQGMDFLGIGPGAHGRLTDMTTHQRVRSFGEFHPNQYMSLCEKEGEGIRKLEPISTHHMAEELVVFGMRTRMGIPRSRFFSMTGKKLDDMIDKDALKMFIDLKLIIDEDGITDERMKDYTPNELLHEWESMGGLRPTEIGLEKIDYILPRLLDITK